MSCLSASTKSLGGPIQIRQSLLARFMIVWCAPSMTGSSAYMLAQALFYSYRLLAVPKPCGMISALVESIYGCQVAKFVNNLTDIV
jgi:hypothetical protein